MEWQEKTLADCNTKDAEIAVSLKYLSNFCRTLDMSLINCGINPILTWSEKFFINNSTGEGVFRE